MPDVPAAIREMARVVAPGGRVTTLELTPMPPGIASGMGRFYFHRLVPLMGQLIAGDRTAYTYLPDSVDYFLTADGLADVFRQAGLVGVGYRHLGLGGVAFALWRQASVRRHVDRKQTVVLNLPGSLKYRLRFSILPQ